MVKWNYEHRYEFSKYLLDPLKSRFWKIVRIMGLVCLFIRYVNIALTSGFSHNLFQNKADRYILTTGRNRVGSMKCSPGLIICLPDSMIMNALQYYRKASNEVKQFLGKKSI